MQFTEEEWQACIKVLTILKENPLDNPNNQLFSGLITKIHRTVKKNNRSQEFERKRKLDLQTLAETVIHKNALSNISLTNDSNREQRTEAKNLEFAKGCYCCNEPFSEIHFFYARLCPKCADENYRYRFENCDLTGRYVLLTGGRIKIGYATALRMLRNNAHVIVTTRFPYLAMKQFQEENDFANWKDRLYIHGLDLRNLRAIEDFVHYYTNTFPALDILINNAAQTIKYDDTYYRSICSEEQIAKNLLCEHDQIFPNSTSVLSGFNELNMGDFSLENIQKTRFGQPVDFRSKTSWNSTLTEIELPEVLEVNLINQIAPFMLIKGLKPLLLKSRFDQKFIINVTSSEGMFSYTKKTQFHPHTNMTKAAFNMLTRTSAQEFEKEGISMISVDVGWISTGAREELRKKQFEAGYIPPLDSVDGASRIFHPIIAGIQKTKLFSGVLLKNYKITNW